VVTKLLNMVGPDVAFFGQKDAQQALVIRRLVRDLDLPVRIEVCPTVREPDGLAMSSRNAYLSPEERRTAPALHQALEAGRAAWRAGAREPAAVEKAAGELLDRAAGVEVQYLALVDPESFEPAAEAVAGQLLAVAARIGTTRLIDNVKLGPAGAPDGRG